jgi:DNA-binding Lrp family transcriptional regulator
MNNNLPIKTKTQMSVTSREYVNQVTGEIEDFTVVTKNVGADFNFHKIWLQDLLNILDSFGSKKVKVITYLLGKMRNEDNTISCTYRSIATDTGISYQTVAVTMKEMIESNVIKKIMASTYQFNPDIIIKGSSGKRQKLLVEYNVMDKTSAEEQIKISDDYYGELALEEKKGQTFLDIDDTNVIEAEISEENNTSKFIPMDDDVDNPVSETYISTEDYIAELEAELADAKGMSPNGYKAVRTKRKKD